jgi:hypothetical protein
MNINHRETENHGGNVQIAKRKKRAAGTGQLSICFALF